MPAPLSPLDDPTPLDADEVDVSVRVAWLLRMARLGGTPPDSTPPGGRAPTGGLSQAAVGAALRVRGVRTHARLMSEVEAGKVRHGRIVDGYEAALGLPAGRLRATVDVLCRSLPSRPFPDRDPGRAGPASDGPTVQEISDLGLRVRGRDHVGGDWLAWARALAAPQARGFPVWLAAEWVDRLVDELGRSVGTAHTTRYEALCLLRGSGYRSVVLDAVRRLLDDPHAQRVLDAVGALTDVPDADAVAWLAGLLRDPRPVALRAACAGLANAAASRRLPDEAWEPVSAAVAEAWDAAARDDRSARLHLLSSLVVALPRRRAEALGPRLEQRPPRPSRCGPLGDRTARNPRWAGAVALADRVLADRVRADRVLPDQAVLARLLFEVVHDHRDARAVVAALTLSATPILDPVFRVLLDHALTESDPAQRARVCRRLTRLAPPGSAEALSDLDAAGALARAGRDDPEMAACRAVLLARTGRRVETEVLDDLADRPDQRRRALYAAGLTQDPWLEKVADDTGRPGPVREAARWWCGRGVLDDEPV